MGRRLETFEIEACAKAAHEVNRAYCEAMADYSHNNWENTPTDLKQIARQSVIGIATFDHNAEQTHEAWVAAKRSDGWNFGPVKNTEKKEHPCLVAWRELPPEQQIKDEMWIKNVKNMLDAFWRIPRQ